ncbi:HsdM family class I SAM-dependent methyltransferase [Phytoactinopolyspora alkaliphila]|uniref:HsdM family class I SAM-dependent methyltransferase n=1 Tax=Phytoactinopolyspora alkaliphila TaxID=1783498 RepID=UPI001C20AC56
MTVPELRGDDTADLRKARGAFFTPPALCDYVVNWAVRSPTDLVLEPSCGEAAFLGSAGDRLALLGASGSPAPGALHGVELHPDSAAHALAVLKSTGHEAQVEVADFFTVRPRPVYDAVVGNPPYVRYQGFSGDNRSRAQEAALRAGVALTGLASSWAAFVVHSAMFLRPGGRLGLVLPAELLTVNYAAEVRRFLMQRFRTVRLVLFTERVFPGVLEEVVLLLADGFDEGPTDHCELFQAANVADLPQAVGRLWRPASPESKWTASLLSPEAISAVEKLTQHRGISVLQAWGETTLGMVTGNNRYFTMSPAAAERHQIDATELLPISPPGSRHLRGLVFSRQAWKDLGAEGRPTHLFRPSGEPSPQAARYIASGEAVDVHEAYKCRVRKPWWRVPLVKPADLLLTYMNADTPRLTTNRARVHHLNSVHGVYLRPGLSRATTDLLPIASLNSMTLLGAETVGRAYGGGMLKIEPKEADKLPVPGPEVLENARADLVAVRTRIAHALRSGQVTDAARIVDDVLLVRHLGLSGTEVDALREAHAHLHARRVARGAGPRQSH